MLNATWMMLAGMCSKYNKMQRDMASAVVLRMETALPPTFDMLPRLHTAEARGQREENGWNLRGRPPPC